MYNASARHLIRIIIVKQIFQQTQFDVGFKRILNGNNVPQYSIRDSGRQIDCSDDGF